jgi:hypothetical protein
MHNTIGKRTASVMAGAALAGVALAGATVQPASAHVQNVYNAPNSKYAVLLWSNHDCGGAMELVPKGHRMRIIEKAGSVFVPANVKMWVVGGIGIPAKKKARCVKLPTLPVVYIHTAYKKV